MAGGLTIRGGPYALGLTGLAAPTGRGGAVFATGGALTAIGLSSSST